MLGSEPICSLQWRYRDIIHAGMDKKDNSLALLPNGFVDLLPPFAEKEAVAIQILMDRFASFGYSRIKPPLLEFEDSLLGAGIGSLLANDTFRLMDHVSHRMLGLRSDTTAQVSRIASSRLENEVRPLRLSYANDVLRTRGSQMRSERQFVQVGCELVTNDNGCDSDVEICVLAILGLKALGLEDITIDFTIPNFVNSVLGKPDAAIEKAVKQRDVEALRSMNSILAQAMEACGAADKALLALKDIKLNDIMQGKINHLENVCAGVNAAMAELSITGVALSIDVLEQTGFEYHNDLGFTIFAANAHGELGRGGSYDLHFGDDERSEMARGFTLYMDTILKAVSISVEKKVVFVSNSERWDIISKLQSEGWVVVRGAAASKNCTHIYENGKVKEIS